jgi:RimJ/RimL family protein N-acetyltransferase
MRVATSRYLDAWYANLLGIQVRDLWQRVTARGHTTLGSYEGYFVAWHGDGAHVSLPASAGQETADYLSGSAVDDVQTLGFWQRFADSRRLRVIGPSIHAYLDTDPGPVPGVVAVEESALGSLRALVDAEEWAESGWDDEPAARFGWYDGGALVAAARLGDFGGRPRDIGVLVAPAWRGRGLSRVLGRHAASFAVREFGCARWCARSTNAASLATARRLGFEPWCIQLALR